MKLDGVVNWSNQTVRLLLKSCLSNASHSLQVI